MLAHYKFSVVTHVCRYPKTSWALSALLRSDTEIDLFKTFSGEPVVSRGQIDGCVSLIRPNQPKISSVRRRTTVENSPRNSFGWENMFVEKISDQITITDRKKDFSTFSRRRSEIFYHMKNEKLTKARARSSWIARPIIQNLNINNVLCLKWTTKLGTDTETTTKKKTLE